MGGARYSRLKTWIAEILTAADLNDEFNNILDNHNPAGMDDASENLAAMRTQRDVTGASLAVSLEEELHGLRSQLDALVGKTYWYEAADTSMKLQFNKGADITSATALPIGAATDGNYFDVTGTTTVTSFTTRRVGDIIRLHFDAALTLTYHATDLILPGGANIITAAGDEATFIEYATGDYRCLSYQRASGQAVIVQDTIRDSHRGLIIIRPTVATIDIDADEIILQNITDVSLRVKDVDVTVDITASGADGLDTGAEAGDTWYYLWTIYNPTTDTVAGMMSLQSTDDATFKSNLPSDYTYYALVGATRNDSGSNLINFAQKDKEVTYTAYQIGKDGSFEVTTDNDIWEALAITNFYPATAKMIDFIWLTDGDPNCGVSPLSTGHAGWSWRTKGSGVAADQGIFPTARENYNTGRIVYAGTVYTYSASAAATLLAKGWSY
jgi:hypothetical protein